MKDSRATRINTLIAEAHTLAAALYDEKPADLNDVKDLSRLVRYLNWCTATTDRLVSR